MKKFNKGFILFAVFSAILVSLFAVSAFAEVYEGDFYEGLSYHIDTEVGVLTISGEGTELGIMNDQDAIVGVGYGGAGLPWKDDGWAGKVTEVVITAPIVRARSYMLSRFSNCVKMTIPATLTTVDDGLFAYDNHLNTVVVAGNEAKEGILDLRNFTTIGGYFFDGALANVTPTVYLGRQLTKFTVNKMAQSCKGLTFKIYSGSVAESWLSKYVAGGVVDDVNNICDFITYEYYTMDEMGELPTSGENTTSGFRFTWAFDAETETLTFDVPEGVTGWNELGTSSAMLLADIGMWKSHVKHIVVAGRFSKVQINGVASMFAGYPELIDINFGSNTGFTEIQASGTTGLFEGNAKMRAIGFGTLTDGVADLSRITKISGVGLTKLFKGCASIETAVFSENLIAQNTNAYYRIDASMFEDCTSLKSITIPERMTELGIKAFAGCTALESVTFLGSPLTIAEGATDIFSDNAGLVITTQTAEDAALINGLGLENAVAMKKIAPLTFEGFAVRTEDYNGLRGVFFFDGIEVDAIEAIGYSLVEYGALVATAENADTFGMLISKEGGSYVTADPSVLKTPVFRNDVFVNKILAGSTADKARFAVSVVNIPEGKETVDLVMAAYVILRTPSGEDMIVYENSSEMSLQHASTQMYKNGLVSFESDADNIVFDAMMSGVVTFTAGADYTVAEGQTDLAGNPIGDTFRFENVPAVAQSVSSKVLGFTPTEVTITLVEDGENYVAVYQGSGNIPGSSQYNNTTYNQLSASFMKLSSKIESVATAIPNPTLKNAGRIKTAIICEGITQAHSEAFATFAVETIMYPTTLKSLSSAQFQGNKSLKTVFRTGDRAEVGLVDLSYIEELDISYFFNSADKIEKIHLPATVTHLGTEAFATNLSLKGIWCGDGEYVEGVADFTGIELVSINNRAFKNVTGISTFKLPDTVTTIANGAGADAPFYGAGGAGIEGSDVKVTITTPGVNDAVAAYAENCAYINYVSDAGIAA